MQKYPTDDDLVSRNSPLNSGRSSRRYWTVRSSGRVAVAFVLLMVLAPVATAVSPGGLADDAAGSSGDTVGGDAQPPGLQFAYSWQTDDGSGSGAADPANSTNGSTAPTNDTEPDGGSDPDASGNGTDPGPHDNGTDPGTPGND